MRNLRLPCDTRKPDIVPMTAGADLDVSRLLMAWAAVRAALAWLREPVVFIALAKWLPWQPASRLAWLREPVVFIAWRRAP